MHEAHSRLFLAALVTSLLLGSCGIVESEEGAKESTSDSTYFRATLNGEEEWSGEPDAAFSQQGRIERWLSISADSVDEKNFPRTENLGFAVPFQNVGNYSLSPTEYDISEGWTRTSGANFYESDGDALLASYNATNDTSANQLTITEYDSTAMVMKGTFRTTVVVDSADREDEPGEPARRRPDTLRFTDGEFRVELRDLRE